VVSATSPDSDEDEPSHVAVTFNHYKSTLLGERFETLARRRGRVGVVERTHEWGAHDAEVFAER